MKKFFLFFLCASLLGCSEKGSLQTFDYAGLNLLGTWKSTYVNRDGEWESIDSPAAAKFTMYLVLRSHEAPRSLSETEGSFVERSYASGKLVSHSGTFAAIGDAILFYSEGAEHMRMRISSFQEGKIKATIEKGDAELPPMRFERSEGEDEGAHVQSIQLLKEEITVTRNGSYHLASVIFPTDASCKEVYWTSSDEEVASVMQNDDLSSATVTGGNKNGEAVITATTREGGLTASCKVINRTKFALSEESMEMHDGTIATLTCLLNDYPCTEAKWECSDPSVLELRPNEKNDTVRMIGLKVGEAVVTASLSEDLKAECKVRVAPLENLFVEYEAEKFHLGYLYCYTAEHEPYLDAVWNSSDPSVASIDGDENSNRALVYANKPGTTILSAVSKDGKQTASYKLVVEVPYVEKYIDLDVRTLFSITGSSTMYVEVRFEMTNNAPPFDVCAVYPTSAAIINTYEGITISPTDLTPNILYPYQVMSGKFPRMKFSYIDNALPVVEFIKEYYKVLIRYEDSKGVSHTMIGDID